MPGAKGVVLGGDLGRAVLEAIPAGWRGSSFGRAHPTHTGRPFVLALAAWPWGPSWCEVQIARGIRALEVIFLRGRHRRNSGSHGEYTKRVGL